MKYYNKIIKMSNFPGKLFLILGPSGVGKGTIINRFREEYAHQFTFPISVTTRAPRSGEVEGTTYYYISEEEFQQKIQNDEFLEYAIVHGSNYYGTLKKSIFDALKEGKNVIRELDIQGFESISKILDRDEFVSIFLLPPSIELLEKRIRERSVLSDEEVFQRMNSARQELEKSKSCHYKVQTVDLDIDGTFSQVQEIVNKELAKDIV